MKLRVVLPEYAAFGYKDRKLRTMPLDRNSLNKFRVNVSPEAASKWMQRRDIPIAILAWIVLGVVILWAAGYIIRTLLVIVVAALLAYALAPGVKLLNRFMPRIVAIIFVYLVVLSCLSLLLYFVINTTILQVTSLVNNISALLTPSGSEHIAPLIKILNSFGITDTQINGFEQQVVNQAQGLVGGIGPLLAGIFDFALDIIIVAVLSVYLLIDGARLKRWIQRNAPLPQRERAQFVMHTLERVVGGYIRGQLTLSILIGVLVGVGMTIFRLPYAVLLGVLAFVLEFIPVLGTLTSGAVCVLIALSEGWLVALGVLIYFIVVHVFEGDIVGPRIVGKAVGLHPALSLVALIAGAELFGIWGAVLAAPLAGLIQALLIAIWQNWRETHPEQFPNAAEGVPEIVETVEVVSAPIHPANDGGASGSAQAERKEKEEILE